MVPTAERATPSRQRLDEARRRSDIAEPLGEGLAAARPTSTRTRSFADEMLLELGTASAPEIFEAVDEPVRSDRDGKLFFTPREVLARLESVTGRRICSYGESRGVTIARK